MTDVTNMHWRRAHRTENPSPPLASGGLPWVTPGAAGRIRVNAISVACTRAVSGMRDAGSAADGQRQIPFRTMGRWGMCDAGSAADGQRQIPPRTMGCWACGMLGQWQMVSGRSRSGQWDVGHARCWVSGRWSAADPAQDNVMLGMRDARSVADGQQQIPPRTMGCWACGMLGQWQMVSSRSRPGQWDVGHALCWVSGRWSVADPAQDNVMLGCGMLGQWQMVSGRSRSGLRILLRAQRRTYYSCLVL